MSLKVATGGETKFPADSTQIIVISYNIRYDIPDDGINRWDNRKH
ncbi:MAG: hypothetical protein U5K69_18085 [Balneolaceae bacterium]|nr:hypothetical protein [Balneolaceae bacterium]